MLTEKVERNDRISMESLQMCFKISRAIVDKSIEEYKFCLNEQEKPLYLM